MIEIIAEQLTVKALYIYPVKSLSGLSVSEISLDSLGAINDRRYMLVDESGRSVSQRRHAKLVLATVDQQGDDWLVTLPELGSKRLPKKGSVEIELAVEVWGDELTAFDQGDAWAEWFSQYLELSVRLVYIPAEPLRLIDKDYSPAKRFVSLTDGYPLLLTSLSSLLAINNELEQKIEINRFRPNIVIDGIKPFAEMQWKTVSFGDVIFDLVKPCSRCVVPTIDPQTAKKQKDVWPVLERLCKGAGKKVYFGQNMIHRLNGEEKQTVRVGQKRDVIE